MLLNHSPKKVRYLYMKRVYVKDGKMYSADETDKLLIEKLENLEKQVSELTKQLSPENKDREETLKRLRAIKKA